MNIETEAFASAEITEGSGIAAMDTIPTYESEEDEIVFSTEEEEKILFATESLGLPTSKAKQFQYLKNKNRISKLAKVDDERAMMPRDCYSFISLHGPSKPIFWFGVMVFVFQICFLLLALLGIVLPEWNTERIEDNPWETRLAKIFATEAGPILRATQILSLFASIIFVDSSVSDIITAIYTFPNYKIATKNDKIWSMAFSCMLRFTQGLLAVIVSLFLVFHSVNVIEVILNFTALNFISSLDNILFDFSKTGKYGPYLENEVKRVESKRIPVCMYRKYKLGRFLFSFMFLFTLMAGFGSFVAYMQEHERIWDTYVFRVQFQDDTLEAFNGCYVNDFRKSESSKRNFYTLDRPITPRNSRDRNEKRTAEFGFCIESQQWFLYTVPEGESKHPCDFVTNTTDVSIISDGTDNFDIKTMFSQDWFTVDGTPADIFFWEEIQDETQLHCDAFIGDGMCDEPFNTETLDYDGGDCCATTCSHGRCGIGQLVKPFNTFDTSLIGDGYPNCKDKAMGPISIHLTNFTNSRKQFKEDLYTQAQLGWIETYLPDFFEEEPTKTLLTLYCDGVRILKVYVDSSMEGQVEEVRVPDEADCEIRFETMSTEDIQGLNGHPIWFIDYAVYNVPKEFVGVLPPNCNGNTFSKSSYSFERIPDCAVQKVLGIYGTEDLSPDKGNMVIRDAIMWVTSATESRDGKCADNYLEILALAVLYFSAPPVVSPATSWIEKQRPVCEWSKTLCVGTTETTTLDLMELQLSELWLFGSIPTEIGFLNNIVKYDVSLNILTGTLPTEIGSLSSLSSLDLEFNLLTGTIPVELFSLTSLEILNLGYNAFTGSIPTEIGLLTGLRELYITSNYLTGTIPTEIGLLTSLSKLSISANAGITGSIPSEIQYLDKMVIMEFFWNGLSGSIPREIGALTSLIYLSFQINPITGAIPREIGLLSNLRYLDIENTSVSGVVPTELGELSHLSLFVDGASLELEQVSPSIGEKIAEGCDLCANYNETDDSFCYLTMQEWGKKQHRTSPGKCNKLQDHCIVCAAEDTEVLIDFELPNN